MARKQHLQNEYCITIIKQTYFILISSTQSILLFLMKIAIKKKAAERTLG